MIKKSRAILFGFLMLAASAVSAEYSSVETNKPILKDNSIATDLSCPGGQHINALKEKCMNTGCFVTNISCS